MLINEIIFLSSLILEKILEEESKITNQNINPFRLPGECLFLPGGRRKKDVNKIYNHWGL